MGEETITVGEVSDGADAGREVELPIVDLLTGRGFITGKSGSGKSNTASVVAEKLLDEGYGLMAVDIDGEYYGLKEEYEILHVGGDEECDLQVSVEHAEKLASLALEQGVPIILDVSSFIDERDARELLKEVAKQLFAKEKKLKQPFLMLVEECHEFIPESAGMDECGRMLVKVGKRGRKHGLGIVGISQRPADVKKDFITQCDWLVWHRLTWSNDTKVAGRILGSEYESDIEDLGDGECFLMSDWDESLRQVQMERKQTFDAGATPGLDDFERPELKSVSSDLMSELEQITEREQQRESRVQQLELELKDKEERIEELEAELEEARDLSQMAEQFSRAMMAHATGRAFREDVTGYQAELDEVADPGDAPDPADDADASTTRTETADDPHAAGAPRAEDFGADRMAEMVGGSETAADGAGVGDVEPEFDDHSGGVDDSDWDGAFDPPESEEPDVAPGEGVPNSKRPVVGRLREKIEQLDPVARGMLAHYHEYGPASPVDAHVTAGGDATRTEAYRRNGRLRDTGLIEHAGRGGYTTRIRDIVVEDHDDRLDDEDVAATVEAIEESLPPAKPPETAEDWPEA
ncbi:ATP-binding protein [Halorarius halobius]|uniref:ATP-binding protein n=1 Tax=Halorarius halobius TaxID=2962671 RepID=UPI0020CBCF2E|nr:DUF87 domain-containing protein [Halorarius halobius]